MTTTIDQHLQEQERLNASFLATIAPVADDSELVLVTPYLRGRCACDHATRFRKHDLEIEPTATTTPCCGKTLRVFRVHVKPGAQVPAIDHVRYALRAARAPGHLGECAQDCLDSFTGCIESAETEEDRRWCSNHYGWCLVDCASPSAVRRTAASPSAVRRTAATACNCEALHERLRLLQEELHEASTAEKAGLIRRINRVLEQIEQCGC